MPAVEKMVLRCERCGEPLLSGATEAGCINCLLLNALAQSDPSVLPRDRGEDASPLSAARHYQHYEILTRADGSWWELGRGAMGVTYKAMDVNLRVPVALKIINTRHSQLADARHRFLREARAAARLRHPNVASVFHFGTITRPATNPDTGLPGEGTEECFYAMEFIDGETLEETLRRTGPFSAALVLEIALQITRALAAAEKRGLVHRDLKPANIMLTAEADTAVGNHGAKPRGGMGDAWVKVIDFGLAKAVNLAAGNTGESQGVAEPATHGGFLGTPQFASPEQFDGREVDVRSDVFSLGVVIWYLLTGEMPFEGRSLAEIHDRQLHRSLPLDHLTEAKVPGPLAGLLADMLAADPAQRPASAAALHDRLEQCAACLHPRAPSLPEESVGRRRNRPPSWAVAAVVMLLLLAAVAAGYGLTHRQSSPVVAEPAGTPPPVSQKKSVAVLPFEDIGGDKDSAFFTEGVQDEVLTDLAQVADLQVISRSSVMGYRPDVPRDHRSIGRDLGVTHVVEGSVQHSGNRVRVSAQIIDTRTDACLWAENYERDLADVFSIQGEIAQVIAGQLQARLSPGEQSALDTVPTHDLTAYQDYQRGKQDLNSTIRRGTEEKQRTVVSEFEEATERDPHFFLAWYGLAHANMTLYQTEDHTPERLARVETAFQTAHRLQPEAGETHFLEGMRRSLDGDNAGAMQELRKAEQKLPNDPEIKWWLGNICSAYGQWDEVIHQYEQAVKVDPRNPTWWNMLANTCAGMGYNREAERALDQAIRLDPQNFEAQFERADLIWEESNDSTAIEQWLRSTAADSEKWRDKNAFITMCLALSKHDYPAAARAFARYRPKTVRYAGISQPRAAIEGWIAQMNGDQATARTLLQLARSQTEEMLGQWSQDPKVMTALARIDGLLGFKEKAISEAQQACALMPRSKNALDWAYITRTTARVYAQLGEWDHALDAIRSINDTPARESYGMLCGEPEWDQLRGYPPFQAYVASLAPKQKR